MNKYDPINIIIFLILIIVFLPACNPSKYLMADDSLVKKNKVKIVSEQTHTDETELQYKLETLYRLKPNRKFFGVNRSWFYFRQKEKAEEKSGALDRFVAKSIAEEPAYFTEEGANQTIQSMENYLFQKGFFNAKVEYQNKVRKKRSITQYTAHLNERYYIKEITFTARDSSIQYIVDSVFNNSPLRAGQVLDLTKYEEERGRLTNAMKNMGYANYYNNLMGDMVIDTVGTEASIEIEILNPANESKHQIFTIGEIHIYPDFNANEDNTSYNLQEFGNIKFHHKDPKMYIQPSVIMQKLQIKEGELFSKDKVEQTYQQINNLGAYKFISIQSQIDSSKNNIIHYNIFLNPTQKWELGADADLNYSTLSVVKRSQIGVSASGSLSNRNLFGGAESFSSSVEAGIEVALGSNQGQGFFNSYSLSFKNELRIPKFVDLFGLYNFLLKDKAYNAIKRKSFTTLSASIDYVDIFNYYKTNSFNFNWEYNYQPNPRHRFIIDQIGINYFDPETRSLFDTILAADPFLANSFGPRLFTGFLFRDISYFYRGPTNPRGISYGLNANFEISGLEIFALNNLVNAINNNNQKFTIGEVDFAHYFKLELDGRRYHQFGQRSVLATRLAFGFTLPYGNYSSTVPFVKQLFVGGPNSIRAWQIRELGPGATIIREPVDRRRPFFQTGNLKLAFNVEYRFDIISRLKGALFLDGGNIWTISDENRPEANFSTDFYRQIALGTGFGMRFDFTYVLLRLDLGYPLRNSWPNENSGRYWIHQNLRDVQWRYLNWNLAIDYPF